MLLVRLRDRLAIYQGPVPSRALPETHDNLQRDSRLNPSCPIIMISYGDFRTWLFRAKSSLVGPGAGFWKGYRQIQLSCLALGRAIRWDIRNQMIVSGSIEQSKGILWVAPLKLCKIWNQYRTEYWSIHCLAPREGVFICAVRKSGNLKHWCHTMVWHAIVGMFKLYCTISSLKYSRWGLKTSFKTRA